MNSPCKRKGWTNSGGPLVNSVLWGVPAGQGRRNRVNYLQELLISGEVESVSPKFSSTDKSRKRETFQYNGIIRPSYKDNKSYFTALRIRIQKCKTSIHVLKDWIFSPETSPESRSLESFTVVCEVPNTWHFWYKQKNGTLFNCKFPGITKEWSLFQT